MRRLAKILLPLLFLAIAVAGAAYLRATRVEPRKTAAREQRVPVEVLEIRQTDEQVVITAQGTVVAAQLVQLMPEVSGKIVAVSEQLVPGGMLRAGEAVVHIDPRDYQVRVASQQEALAGARLRLQEERARQRVAEQEWALLEGALPDDQANRELALRIPQIEQAESALAAAQGALAGAQLDLERCTLTAPFDAVVISENVDPGQVVNPQTQAATLVGTDHYWVQAALPVEDLTWMDVPGSAGEGGSSARVIHSAGAVQISREGRVQRLLGDVDPAGRLARLLVVIDDPLGLEDGEGGAALPLLLGSYVTVEIAGHTLEDVVVVPRKALREVKTGGGTGTREGLWIMDANDRLAIRVAEVVWRSETTVLTRNGFADGERIVTSILSTPIEGLKLTVVPATATGG